MAWKQIFVLVVGGLALLGAGTAALRPCAVRTAPAVSAPSEVGNSAPDPVAPSASIRTKPQADLALAVLRGYTEILRGVEPLETKKQDLQLQTALLAQSLRTEPAAWDDVIDLLALYEPEEAALGAARGLQEAVDPVVESKLSILLARAPSSMIRRLALAMLGRRDSGEITSALVASLQSPDPRLRAEVLEALAYRRGISGSSSLGPIVDAALRSRAESEPDPVLRRSEHCLVGDETASVRPTPARRAPLSSATIGSRSR